MANDLEAPKPFVPSGFTDGNKLDSGGIEQMRFGLAGSGPLAKAVLDSNVVGARIQLGLGATPIAGIISMYGGTALPAGYLWCDGSAYDKTVYPGLFTALGVNRYGVDTATQFFLPNLTSHLPRGAATTSGAVTTNNNNTPNHSVNATNATAAAPTTNSDGAHNHSISAAAATAGGGGHGHNNNGANTGGPSSNLNRGATGAQAGVSSSGHTHGVNGASTSSNAEHNHTVNATANTNSDGAHNHTLSAGAITVTSGTIVNAAYVPAFVEVNYIIKT